MGKIFDALEKASNLSGIKSKTGQLAPNKSKNKNEQDAKSNVVQFANLAQDDVATELDDHLIAFHSPNSMEADIFKALRTNLLFPSNKKPPKCIMVTSAVPGDGKSFVSSNLSVSLAQGVEEHVLLIDMDIRSPSLEKIFGLDNVIGLSDYLKDGKDVGDYLRRTKIDKLTMLGAGKTSHNPTELLTTQKMKSLIKEVVSRYKDRYVIIDSAPPSIASETAAISSYVDGIVIVVKAGKTPRKAIADTIKRLDKDKILGVILNFSDKLPNKYYSYEKRK